MDPDASTQKKDLKNNDGLDMSGSCSEEIPAVLGDLPPVVFPDETSRTIVPSNHTAEISLGCSNNDSVFEGAVGFTYKEKDCDTPTKYNSLASDIPNIDKELDKKENTEEVKQDSYTDNNPSSSINNKNSTSINSGQVCSSFGQGKNNEIESSSDNFMEVSDSPVTVNTDSDEDEEVASFSRKQNIIGTSSSDDKETDCNDSLHTSKLTVNTPALVSDVSNLTNAIRSVDNNNQTEISSSKTFFTSLSCSQPLFSNKTKPLFGESTKISSNSFHSQNEKTKDTFSNPLNDNLNSGSEINLFSNTSASKSSFLIKAPSFNIPTSTAVSDVCNKMPVTSNSSDIKFGENQSSVTSGNNSVFGNVDFTKSTESPGSIFKLTRNPFADTLASSESTKRSTPVFNFKFSNTMSPTPSTSRMTETKSNFFSSDNNSKDFSSLFSSPLKSPKPITFGAKADFTTSSIGSTSAVGLFDGQSCSSGDSKTKSLFGNPVKFQITQESKNKSSENCTELPKFEFSKSGEYKKFYFQSSPVDSKNENKAFSFGPLIRENINEESASAQSFADKTNEKVKSNDAGSLFKSSPFSGISTGFTFGLPKSNISSTEPLFEGSGFGSLFMSQSTSNSGQLFTSPNTSNSRPKTASPSTFNFGTSTSQNNASFKFKGTEKKPRHKPFFSQQGISNSSVVKSYATPVKQNTPFRAVKDSDACVKYGTTQVIQVRHQYITAMPEYSSFSFEELRCQHEKYSIKSPIEFKLMVDKITQTSDTLHEDYLADIWKMLECPICLDIVSPPVHQCDQGHHACNNCWKQVASCPLCKRYKSQTRNYVAEAIIEKLPLPCKYRVDGCMMTFRQKEKLAHEERCLYRTYFCLAEGCKKACCFKDMKIHLKTTHGGLTSGIPLYIERGDKFCWTLIKHNLQNLVHAFDIPDWGLLFLCHKKYGQNSCIWMQILNARNTHDQFLYSVEVADIKQLRSVSYKGPVIPLHAKINEQQDCLIIVENLVKSLKSDYGLHMKITVWKKLSLTP